MVFLTQGLRPGLHSCAASRLIGSARSEPRLDPTTASRLMELCAIGRNECGDPSHTDCVSIYIVVAMRLAMRRRGFYFGKCKVATLRPK